MSSEDGTPPEMEGYLYKRGAINRAFKKRYFRRDGRSLLYFTAPDVKKPQGEVDLTSVISVSIENSRECPPGTPPKELIITTAKRRWVFAAESEDLLQAWCKELTRVAADVSPVARNNIHNVLAERQEKELRTLSTEASLNTLSMTETTVSELPITITPTVMSFGENRHIPIETETETTLELKNESRDRISFRFFHQNDRTRYKLRVDPSQGSLNKGASLSVKCVIYPLCTARVSDKVSLIVWRGSPKALQSSSTRVLHSRIDMTYESKLSTKLDALELKTFDPVGEGGYGVVWKGRYRGLDVAVKSLKIDDDVTDVLEDFHHEVSSLEPLRHPNIVNYVGSVITPTKLAIVTEFCPFGNLCSAFSNHKLPLSFKIRCLQDTVKGMDFLHQSNIIHRDLKPQNILVVSLEPGSVVVAKISDFGTVRNFVNVRSAKRMTLKRQEDPSAPVDLKSSMTRGVGTTAYMAPEILKASMYDKPADVYSFSMVIYFLCTGKEPYSDLEHMAAWQFTKRVGEGGRPTIPKECVTGSNKDLLDIMVQCWQQDPARRPTFSDLNTVFQRMPLPAATDSSPVVVDESSVEQSAESTEPGVTPEQEQPSQIPLKNEKSVGGSFARNTQFHHQEHPSLRRVSVATSAMGGRPDITGDFPSKPPGGAPQRPIPGRPKFVSQTCRPARKQYGIGDF